MRRFLKEKIAEPLRRQLVQGVSPDDLARACAMGGTLGVFPFLGTTTALCAVAGAVLKLNQPAIQVANYAASPLQLLLIPVYLSAGTRLFGLPAVSVNLARVPGLFWEDPAGFLARYGLAGMAGAAVWAATAPLAGAVLYFLLRRAFRRMSALLGVRLASGTP